MLLPFPCYPSCNYWCEQENSIEGNDANWCDTLHEQAKDNLGTELTERNTMSPYGMPTLSHSIPATSLGDNSSLQSRAYLPLGVHRQILPERRRQQESLR